MQVGEGRQAGTKVWMEYSKKRVNELAVKKENFQTRSGVLWLPEFSSRSKERQPTAYRPKALKS